MGVVHAAGAGQLDHVVVFVMLIDTHCHLQMPQYDADREDVIRRMKDKQMVGVVIGTNLFDSQNAVRLAENYDFLFATVGLHPTEVENELFQETAFREFLHHPKVVAVGETGMDYFHGTEKKQQKKLFLRQAAFAKETGKPLIIHCRDAYDDMLEAIEKEKISNFVFHTFSGDETAAKRIMLFGGYLSFSGIVTFDKTGLIERVLKDLPLDRMLIETDAPFLTPVPYRGQRNEPIFVEEVAKKIAAIKDLSIETVIEQTAKNAIKLFGLSRNIFVT